MSIRQGGKVIAGGSQALPLLTFMWADHKLNDVSWLRADTFSWQNGTVYKAAYQHLVDDINEISKWSLWKDDNNNSVFTKKIVPYVGEMTYTNSTFTTEVGVITATGLSNGQQTITVNNVVYTQSGTFSIEGEGSETIAGINVMVFVAKDGHKICLTLTHDESDIDAIYNATGVAWYYILDLGNQRFKLPRSQWGVVGLRDTVGKYVPESLPDHNHTITQPVYWGSRNTYVAAHWTADDGVMGANATATSSMASASNSTYKDGAPVQQRATQMYLYFYVGEFTQTAIENTAGVTTEVLNDKVDKGHQVVEFQAPTAANNYTWYRKYADGWVEQGGHDTTTRTTSAASSADATVVFPVEFSDTNYTFNATVNGTYCGIQEKAGYTRTTTNLKVDILATYPNNSYTSKGFDWFACGMAA